MKHTAPHFLYRCYDAQDRLLYVGCTDDVAARMIVHRSGMHQRASRWLRIAMTRYEVEGPYPDRAAGLLAEREAIWAEQPLFNIQHRGRPSWLIDLDVARYMESLGRADLAAELRAPFERDEAEEEAVSQRARANERKAEAVERVKAEAERRASA